MEEKDHTQFVCGDLFLIAWYSLESILVWECVHNCLLDSRAYIALFLPELDDNANKSIQI